jgi:hypothetical protein
MSDDNKAFVFDLRMREIQSRQVRDGNAMLFQNRTLIHNPDGTKETSDWCTTGSIPNYGDCFDEKPSLLQRVIAWFY